MKTIILTLTIVAMTFSACKTKANATTSTIKTNNTEVSEPNINLNDIWALQSIEGNDYSMKTMKGLKVPTIEINLAEKRYSGNDACNSIFGALDFITATTINFVHGGSTRMFCEDDKISTIYMEKLHSASTYKIEKSNLILMDENGKTVLTFRKVD